jgi:hypothetical protein
MLNRAASLVVALVLAVGPLVAAACASVCLPGGGSGTHSAAAAARHEHDGTAYADAADAHAEAHHAGPSGHQHRQAVAVHHAVADHHAIAGHHAPPAFPVRMVAPHLRDCCAGRRALSPAVPAARADLTLIPAVTAVLALDTARALPLAWGGRCDNPRPALHSPARPLVALRI